MKSLPQVKLTIAMSLGFPLQLKSEKILNMKRKNYQTTASTKVQATAQICIGANGSALSPCIVSAGKFVNSTYALNLPYVTTTV